MQAIQALLEYASYMPHGYCLFWQPWLIVLYAGSDLLIFVAYSLIPIALITFLRRRPDIRYRGLVALFAAFILLCGLTHLVSILTLWVPVYPLHGLVKLITGLVSIATAAVLFVLVPRLVAIPSPHQLQEANARLRAEIAAHEATLVQLREARRNLEEKIEARTAELRQANQNLAVATQEAVHRGKNLLGLVASLARQTVRGFPDPHSLLDSFLGRINALSNANAALIRNAAGTSAPLEAVARRQLDPMLLTYGDRIRIDGPAVAVSAAAAQQIALALHELATNAIKFGALRGPTGSVGITWRIDGERPGGEFALEWRESAAAPAATLAERKEREATDRGFGTTLLMRAVPTTLHGEAARSIDDTGLRYELRVPLSSISPEASATGGPSVENGPTPTSGPTACPIAASRP